MWISQYIALDTSLGDTRPTPRNPCLDSSSPETLETQLRKTVGFHAGLTWGQEVMSLGVHGKVPSADLTQMTSASLGLRVLICETSWSCPSSRKTGVHRTCTWGSSLLASCASVSLGRAASPLGPLSGDPEIWGDLYFFGEGSWYTAQAGLQLILLPQSPLVLGLQTCTTTPRWTCTFNKLPKGI
jgi:hypothetical protein